MTMAQIQTLISQDVGLRYEPFAEDDWRRFLFSIGEDPDRPGLLETPRRVAKAWRQWTSGYEQDPQTLLKTFADGAEGYGETVVVSGIPIYSHCEHHLAPFFGHASIGYIPNGTILGLSKLTRLAHCFARRLQVQERLTMQIGDSLNELLKPKAVGVRITCRHLCMESRGILASGEETVTTAFYGEFRTNDASRAQFLSELRKR